MGGVSPTDDLDMEDFQDTQNNAPNCDIYVFGYAHAQFDMINIVTYVLIFS